MRYARVDGAFQHSPWEVQKHYKFLLLHRGTLPTDDIIIITTTPFQLKSVSLYEIHFNLERAPSIVDLAIVLKAASSLALTDDILSASMCYWHARMVFESLASAVPGQIQEGNEPHRRGKFGKILGAVDVDGRFLLAKLDLCRRVSDVRELLSLSNVFQRISFFQAEVNRLRYEKREKIRERGESSDAEVCRLFCICPGKPPYEC